MQSQYAGGETVGEQARRPVLTCGSCSGVNRSIAKFCKHCGTVIESRTSERASEPACEIDDLVGLESVKKEISSIVSVLRIHKERKDAGLPTDPLYLHSVFKGSTGTGKTLVARFMAKKFKDLGVLSKGTFLEIDSEQLSKAASQNLSETVGKWIDKARGGILFFDEIHKHIDRLSGIIKELETAGDDVIVIIAGIRNPIDKHFEEHPDDRQRIGNVFDFGDYTADDLILMAKMKLEKGGFTVADAALDVMSDYIREELYSGRNEFRNGWLVERRILPSIRSRQSARLTAMTSRSKADLVAILPSDVPSDGIVKKTPDEIIAGLDRLVGLASLKSEIRKIAQTLNIQKEQEFAGMKGASFGLHFVFTGNPGTGKTTVARMMGELFKAMGYLPGGQLVETDRSKLVAQYVGQTAPNVNRYCDMAMGGILFIDEAYTLAGEEGTSDSFGKEAIDALLKRMEDDRGKFIVIAAGYGDDMHRFLSSNSGLSSRFTKVLNFDDYTPDELYRIFVQMAEKAGHIVGAGAEEKLRTAFKELYEKRDKKFGNGRTVRNVFEGAVRELGSRLFSLDASNRTPETLRTFTADDIPVQVQKTESIEEIMKEMDSLVGMDAIKKEIRDLVDFVNMQKKREALEGKKTDIALHFVLTGNPGTGKTTVARIIGRLFRSIGILPTNTVIETDKAGMVGQYVGTTPRKVHELVDRAMGGVLFIDEAYTLTPENGTDTFSQEAIDTLMKRMEDNRGKFIVMAAGYKKEMDRFLGANPGLRSRFNRYFHFSDYNPTELKAIFMTICRDKGYQLSDCANVMLEKILEDMYSGRDVNFGNGRDVRNLFEKTLQNQASRLAAAYKDREPDSKEAFSLIDAADFGYSKKDAASGFEESSAKLQALTGLRGVKSQVSELVSFLEVEKMRQQQSGEKYLPTFHFVFTGNPGTGKTTVARIMADIFKSLGILPKGHLVETDRGSLVGQYVGETAQKTKAVIDSAMGGVLFIDEAYALVPEGGGNDFGKEAIDALLKRMEDDKGKFIVIAAGYKKEMDRFIGSNPGLPSRFTKYIDFEDYQPEELVSIFEGFSSGKKFRLGEGFREKLSERCRDIYDSRNSNFANGRTVRNLFDATVLKQSTRIKASSGAQVDSMIFTLEPEDLA